MQQSQNGNAKRQQEMLKSLPAMQKQKPAAPKAPKAAGGIPSMGGLKRPGGKVPPSAKR